MPPTHFLVALVDDDVSFREAITSLIRSCGFCVVAFDSAESFLASDSVERVACIVTDMAMPGMSGPDLQAQLAARGRAAPMIFVTAQADLRSRQQVMSAGAVSFLEKTCIPTELLSHIQCALGLSAIASDTPSLDAAVPIATSMANATT
jgi:FixJ family two-component response regulator